LTLAIIPALIVDAGGDYFAIPQVNLLELVRLESQQARSGIETIHGAPIFRLRGSLLPLVDLDRLLSSSSSESHQARRLGELQESDVDFTAVREMHLRWRNRLTRLLDGQEDIGLDQLVSPDRCELGKWMRGPGTLKFGERPEFVHLDNIHKEIHTAVQKVVEFHHGGNSAKARDALSKVYSLSNDVVYALAKLEQLAESDSLVNIVVLQADGRRFGLVVHGINDTEEIVVKPLGKQLKSVSLFAGATIMGDGRVSLILDVAGIAQRAGVFTGMAERVAREEAEKERELKDERSAYLLLKHGTDGRVAIPLSLVARLEEIPYSAIEHSGGREVVQYRNQIIPLVRLSQALNHHRSETTDRDPMQVVVYAQQGQSVGLVVDTILDIVEDTIHIRPSGGGQGLIGSAVIQQRVTDVLDVPGLIRTVAPDLVLS
jgi:chemotaxis protein histidine kinase CheA